MTGDPTGGVVDPADGVRAVHGGEAARHEAADDPAATRWQRFRRRRRLRILRRRLLDHDILAW
jgi:hypothetical protein